MIKRVKTKTSTPGRSSVKGSKIEKGNILDIFSGSDEDSSENSKAFDNPQETRSRDSSQDAQTPELVTPEVGDPGRTGADVQSPNFKINTKQLTAQPKAMMEMKDQPVSDRARYPLADVKTQDRPVPALAQTSMSKQVLEKYPQANEVARSNASYPSDFASEFSPLRKGFNADFTDQRNETKNQVYQRVTEIPFEKMNDQRTEIKTKAEEKVKEYTDPQIQADYFTSQGKEALTPDFLKQEMSPSNVFNEYSTATGDYGKGKFPETEKASSTLTEKTGEAGRASSPQRGADALSTTNGKSSFQGGEAKTPGVNVDQGIREKVMSASDSSGMLSSGSGTKSLGSEAKSFFFSNFGPISPTISDTMSNSSASTDSASSEVSSNMNI